MASVTERKIAATINDIRGLEILKEGWGTRELELLSTLALNLGNLASVAREELRGGSPEAEPEATDTETFEVAEIITQPNGRMVITMRRTQ